MINVIYGGDEAFDALLYTQENPINQQYVVQQLERVNTALSDSGRAFMDASRELYERIHNSEAAQAARAALRMAKSLFQPNVIGYLDTLDRLQSAPPIMQRWIMSSPEVRPLYQQQRCHGYGEAYITDMSPGQSLEQDYNWRRVMDGVVVMEETDDGWGWYSRQYVEEILPGDRELINFEKLDILRTWDIVRMAIEAGDDPTNPAGGTL